MSLRTRRRVLAGALVGMLGTPVLRQARAQSPREIHIVAQRFRYTPDVVRIQAGERVVLVFRALDFVHGFHVPDLKLRADLLPGLQTRVELPPLPAGTLDFLCDNFCGDEHEDMHGRLLVVA